MRSLLSRFLVTGIFLIAATTAASDLFGNLRIEMGSGQGMSPVGLMLQLDGRVIDQTLAHGDVVTVWQIRAGRQLISMRVDGKEVIDTVEILPNLTFGVILEEEHGTWSLRRTGRVDPTGAVVSLSAADLSNAPGELTDVLAPFTMSKDGTIGYAWNGMRLESPANRQQLSLDNKASPMMAVVSLTDPFAGSGDSMVALTPVWGERLQSRFSSLYGTHDQRNTRGDLQFPLPDDLGMFRTAVSYENSEDATPRSNIDYRLPHNGLDNLEVLSSARLRIGSRFTSETDLLYKSYERDHYLHAYYFDVPHMPREEGYQYSGRTMLYGWLNPTLFLQGSFRLYGNEQIIGDGTHFENLLGYREAESNSRWDDFALFYDGDLSPVLDENDSCLYGCGDDGHFYDDLSKYRVNGFGADFSLTRIIGNGTRVSAMAYFNRDTYRQYHNMQPTYPTSWLTSAIGYDLYGNVTNDAWQFGMPSRPTTFGLTLDAQHSGKRTYGRGEIDLRMFDPHALVFVDNEYPLDSERGYDTRLERRDLKEAGASTTITWKGAVGYHLTEAIDIYARAGRTAESPELRLLYMDSSLTELFINAGMAGYVIENAALEPVITTTLGFGIHYRTPHAEYMLDYQHRTIKNTVLTFYQSPGFPRSYEQWRNDDPAHFPVESRLTGVVRTRGDRVLGGQVAASYFFSNEYWIDSTSYWVRWDGDFSYQSIDRFAVSALGYCDFEQAKTGSLPFSTILSRLRFDLQATARTGVRYSPMRIDNEVTLYNHSPQPIGQAQSGRAKNFVEINVGLTARIYRFANKNFTIRLEVLNLLDRENWVRVYSGTGLPDNTYWLSTAEGQTFIQNNSTPDYTGLNGLQKYLLRQNDPNNFGRPRIIRILAQLSF